MRKFFLRLFKRTPDTSLTSLPPAAPVPSADTASLPLAAAPPQTANTSFSPQPLAVTMKRPPTAAAIDLPEYHVPDKATMERIVSEQRSDRAEFGEELRFVTARQRQASYNIEKLRRFRLPVFYSEVELARWLGISLGRLRWYTFDNPADTTWHYTRSVHKKRSGGDRVILAPKSDLKALQRKVLDGIVAKVPVDDAVHGFVKGRSIVTNAQIHAGKQVILRLDLQDFFPSVTYPRVRGLFIALGYSYAVAAALALLCTEYDRVAYERDGKRYFISVGPRHLVQGAPTSPALANLVAWKLDRRLGGLAAKRGFTYTRYADDLTFSANSEVGLESLRQVAQRIINEEHFTPNIPKTRVARQSSRQIVTGLVVNQAPGTPRELRRRLRAILHNAEKTGLAAQNREGRPNFRSYLQGLIAFIHSARQEQAAPLAAELERIAPRE